MLAIVVAAVVSWSLALHAGTDGNGKGLGQKSIPAKSSKPQSKPDVKTSGPGNSTRNLPKEKPRTTRGPKRVEKAPAKVTCAETVALRDIDGLDLLSRDPLELLRLDNIKPLYTAPVLPGEGVWETCNSPRDAQGAPIFYKTFYRPSVDFPNAVVYMMIVDMSKTFMQYYVGSQEPAAPEATSEVERELRSYMLAITNAMWQQRHSQGAGAIFRGRVLYPMIDGMATLIVYRDGSVDIQEWSEDIPVRLVRDARQLRHLIVKNGVVVQAVNRNGRLEDSEIGLGFLLGGGGKDQDGNHFWYVAHRSAFGIRKDGNLVFAIGHHIGSKDLAKALVLAGCERGIHADANPANIVGNLYIRDSYGNLVRKLRLSPEQSKYSLTRYEDGYSKDFFAFFLRKPPTSTGRALSRYKKTSNPSHP